MGRIRKKQVMPQDRLLTSMDKSEHINSIAALSGGHHNLGAPRNWHFLIVPVWILNDISHTTLIAVPGE